MQIKIISCETLKEYMQRDDCILLDLREKADYEQGHLPGAVCRLGNFGAKYRHYFRTAGKRDTSHCIVLRQR